jgi:hypothetical protein
MSDGCASKCNAKVETALRDAMNGQPLPPQSVVLDLRFFLLLFAFIIIIIIRMMIVVIISTRVAVELLYFFCKSKQASEMAVSNRPLVFTLVF